MQHGFIKVAAAIPPVSVADCSSNTVQIENIMAQASGMGAEILCLPELAITAYTCQDLFQQQLLLEQSEQALLSLIEFSRGLDVITLVGVPIAWNHSLLNCAAVIQHGRIHALVPKTFLPNYKEFYESRWFTSANNLPDDCHIHFCGQTVPVTSKILFSTGRCTFGIELCEDLWAPVPPSSALALAGADIIFNLSASNELVGKTAYLESLIETQSARLVAGYVYASCGFGESTQDVVFSGHALIYENGHRLAAAPRHTCKPQLVCTEIDVEALRAERRMRTTYAACYAAQGMPNFHVVTLDARPAADPLELTRFVDPHPFLPQGPKLAERCEDILSIQAEALARRVQHTHAKTVIIGISGGLDSTLALLVAVRAFDLLGLSRRGIVGITMPGFGTTGRTYTNALHLMETLGITTRDINIADAVTLHFRDIGHDASVHDLTYENSQARERTQVLMDAAGQTGGFVVGTGDMSELALGWATYNGDHMSMYGVNASIPKTLVRHLVEYEARRNEDEHARQTLLDIVATPISPELLPPSEDGEKILQVTEDLVGPYELHDFFLYHTLRHAFRPSKVYFLACRAFCAPQGTGAYTTDVMLKWLRTFYQRFFSQQFKRSCLPDGPKVGSCSLSPRGDWRMPTDATVADWLKDLDSLGTEAPQA